MAAYAHERSAAGGAVWLAVAVATLWLLSVGGLAEATIPASTLLPLAKADGPPSRPRRATQLRLVSVFRQGWITILVALFNQHRLPLGRFVPEPWPHPKDKPLNRPLIDDLPLAA